MNQDLEKILEFRNKIIQEFNSTLGIPLKYLNNFKESKQIKLFKRLPRKLKKKLKKHATI